MCEHNPMAQPESVGGLFITLADAGCKASRRPQGKLFVNKMHR